MAKKNDTDDPGYNEENINDDTFGLPDIEYRPLDPKEGDSLRESDASTPFADDDEAVHDKGSKDQQTENRYMKEKEFPRLPDEEEEAPNRNWFWVLLLIIVSGIALFLAYKYLYLPRKQQQQETARALEKSLQEEAREAEEAAKRQAEEETKADGSSKAAIPTGVGSIEELTTRTGRYYVIVSSSVDGDLAMDYAKKLKKKGLEVKIFKSKGQLAFTRVAVANYATLDEARSGLETVRRQFGVGWVRKY